MRVIFAPARLPLALKPLPAELISSCLLRVAAANGLSFGELLEGFEVRHPGLLSRGQVLDCGLPRRTLEALASFCRLPVRKLEALDLWRRAPRLDIAWLLRFRSGSPWCMRGSHHRLRYAFCPTCIARQSVTHIPWDWCLAWLVRCPVHRTLLQEGCPVCGEPDPLLFTPPNQPPSHACWSCAGDLAGLRDNPEIAPEQDGIQITETVYRAELADIPPRPKRLGKATHQSLRRFMDDMLLVLVRILSPHLASPNLADSDNTWVTRQDRLRIVGELVLNATPDGGVRQRRSQSARGLLLWGALLKMMVESDA